MADPHEARGEHVHEEAADELDHVKRHDSPPTSVKRGLSAIQASSFLDLVRELLVEPYAIERDWDYGAAGQK